MIGRLSLIFKVRAILPHYIIADSGYKTPAIAHYLLERNIIPVLPLYSSKGSKGELNGGTWKNGR